MPLRKGYSTIDGSQVHWRMWGERNVGRAPDLYCFHPAPFSGLAFENFAPLLVERRRVIAPDYPGYGGSDAPTGKLSIELIAQAMAGLAATLSGERPIDVLGFHTGCLVAVEIQRVSECHVRKACLIDIPAFEDEMAAQMVAKFSQPFVVGEDLASLEAPWNGTFKPRLATQGPDQAIALLAEQLRAGRNVNEAFRAAFSYPWKERFPASTAGTLIIASTSGLLDGTLKSARIIPAAQLVERLEIARSVLDESGKATAADVLAFLEA